jgi:apolipoprotein D and lipocalin family protein
MPKYPRSTLAAGVLALQVLAASHAQAADAPAVAPPPLATIATLDLARYMGPWTEIARYPNRFQKQCAGASTATYSLLPEGTVRVVNRCPQADGKVDEAIGEARRIGPPGSAQLQVRFAPAWLSFLPMVRPLLGGGTGRRLPAGRRQRTDARIPLGPVAAAQFVAGSVVGFDRAFAGAGL